MTATSTAWVAYDALPESAKAALQAITDTADAAEVETHARSREWQVEQVPTEVVKRRVMRSTELRGEWGEDFAAYHHWYLTAMPVPDHGDSRWPVVESHGTTEYLDDGWHRLHAYVRAGDITIPVLRSRAAESVGGYCDHHPNDTTGASA